MKNLIAPIYGRIGQNIRAGLAPAMVAGFLAFAPASPAIAQDTGWVGDFPVMPSLTLEGGLGFSFESPDGPIVLLYMSGEATLEDVWEYYGAALEPLGWQKSGAEDEFTWQREGDSLEMDKVSAAGVVLWRVRIRPTPDE